MKSFFWYKFKCNGFIENNKKVVVVTIWSQDSIMRKWKYDLEPRFWGNYMAFTLLVLLLL